MDTLEAIRTILAVRSYRDEPVPDDVIHDILESGRLTASASNKQPWHFVVVRDRVTLQALADHSGGNGPYIGQAAFAIVVVVDKSRFAVSDATRAAQDMLLTAWSRGVGGNWVGFVGLLDEFHTVLGIPDDFDIVTVLPFGYPADDTIGKGHKNRKPLADIVHWDTWGTHA